MRTKFLSARWRRMVNAVQFERHTYSVVMEEGERTNPVYVLEGDVSRGPCFVAIKRGFGSVLTPLEFRVFAFERLNEQAFVIAEQAYNFVRRPLLKINKEFNDPSTIGAAIDVVAEEDKLGSSLARVALAELDKPLELIQAPMNVTDCINSVHCGLQNSLGDASITGTP